MAASGLLSITETATALRVSARTLFEWRRRAFGPVPVRVGRSIRYRAADLERFLDELQDDMLTEYLSAAGRTA